MLNIAILCGGKATRLGKITKNIPKSLIDINGKPFIYHQLELLKKNGFNDIVLCLGHMGEQIQEYVCKHVKGMSFCFSYDGETPLGTGGAIINALPFLSDRFFVLYGDSYLPVNYQKIGIHYPGCLTAGLMTIYKNNNPHHQNNVAIANNRVIKYNKGESTGSYIDYGISIFYKHVLENNFKVEPFDLEKIYQLHIQYNNLYALEIKQRFYEIGSRKGIEELENYLKEKNNNG